MKLFDEKFFNFNRLQLNEVLKIVRLSNEQGSTEIKCVYEIWYQFALSQV